MATFGEAIRSAVREAACAVLGNIAAFDALVAQRVTTLTGVQSRSYLSHVYNQACQVPPANNPQEFTGGQCNKQYDLKYGINYTYKRLSDGSTQVSNTPFGLRVRRQGPVSAIYVEQYGQSGIRIHNIGADGDFVVNYSADGVLNRTISCTLTGIQVTPTDGSADNCGNPTPAPVPGPGTVNNNYTTNITYNDNQNNSVTIPVAIAIGYATVNLNGQIEIPVSLNFTANPTLNVTGNLNFNTGDFNVILDPRLPPSGCGDSPGSNKPDPDTPPGSTVGLPDVSLPAPSITVDSVKRMKGVTVTVSEIGAKVGTFQQSQNPDIIIPNAGYVSFQIQLGDKTFWTEDIPVKNKRQIIACPWEPGAIDVKGTPRDGVFWTISPVWLTLTFDKRFPPP